MENCVVYTGVSTTSSTPKLGKASTRSIRDSWVEFTDRRRTPRILQIEDEDKRNRGIQHLKDRLKAV